MKFFLAEKKDYSLFRGLIPDNILIALRDRSYDIFGLATDDNYIVGTLVLTYISEDASIEWIHILPKYRRQGLATKLLDYVTEFLMQHTEAAWLDATFDFRPYDNDLYYFVKANGFELRDLSLGCYQFSVGDLLETKDHYDKVKSSHIYSLKDISIASKNKIQQFLNFPALLDDYDGQLSLVKLTDNKVEGIILVKKLQNCYELDWIQADASSPAIALGLIAEFIRMAQKMPADTQILTSPVDPRTLDILFKIVPKAKELKAIRAIYYLQ